MNSNLDQGSARIYQFPARGRVALGRRRNEGGTCVNSSVIGRVHEAACSDGWYHQEAIRDAEALREH